MKKHKSNTNKFSSTEIKKNNYVNEDYKKVEAFIIILLVISIFIGLVYFLNGKYVTKDEFQNTTTTTTVPSYDDTITIVDKMFTIDKDEYMVLLYDKSERETSILYDGLVMSYSGNLNLYSIDLSNQMNVKYYNPKGQENSKPTKSSEVMITKPTLVTIKEGKVTAYITNPDEITKKLSEKAEN